MKIIYWLVFGLFGMLMSWLHMRYFCDTVADWVGYRISIFATPLLVFVVFGLVLCLSGFLPLKKWWWLMAGVALVLTYLPIGLFLFGQEVFGDS